MLNKGHPLPEIQSNHLSKCSFLLSAHIDVLDMLSDHSNLLFCPPRNGFCTTIPSLLSGHSDVLPKEVSDSLCYWSFWDGFDLCPCSLHSAAPGQVCLARYAGIICK